MWKKKFLPKNRFQWVSIPSEKIAFGKKSIENDQPENKILLTLDQPGNEMKLVHLRYSDSILRSNGWYLTLKIQRWSLLLQTP